MRIELTTFRLTAGCSNQLSYSTTSTKVRAPPSSQPSIPERDDTPSRADALIHMSFFDNVSRRCELQPSKNEACLSTLPAKRGVPGDRRPSGAQTEALTGLSYSTWLQEVWSSSQSMKQTRRVCGSMHEGASELTARTRKRPLLSPHAQPKEGTPGLAGRMSDGLLSG
jgi:hypothetical protein